MDVRQGERETNCRCPYMFVSKVQRDHARCCRRHGQVDGKSSKGKGKKRGREEKSTGQTGPAEKGKEAALEKVIRSSRHATNRSSIHIFTLDEP